jgi:hypothetical protein
MPTLKNKMSPFMGAYTGTKEQAIARRRKEVMQMQEKEAAKMEKATRKNGGKKNGR